MCSFYYTNIITLKKLLFCMNEHNKGVVWRLSLALTPIYQQIHKTRGVCAQVKWIEIHITLLFIYVYTRRFLKRSITIRGLAVNVIQHAIKLIAAKTMENRKSERLFNAYHIWMWITTLANKFYHKLCITFNINILYLTYNSRRTREYSYSEKRKISFWVCLLCVMR